MNLRKLRHVVVLARSGSFVRAARELNLSPSALSRSIQTIEAEMNVMLFSRGKGGIFPTPAGVKVIAAASALLDSAADLQRSLNSLGELELGEVAFGMGPLPASVILRPLFEAALERCDMRVHVDIQSGMRLLDKLNAGVIEFFVCAEGAVTRAPHIAIDVIATFELAALVRPQHPLAGERNLTADQFYAFPQIGGAFAPDSRLKQNVVVDTRYDPLISCDAYHIFAEVLRSSDAVGLFPVTFDAPDLVPLHCRSGVFHDRLPIVLVRSKLAAPSRGAERLINEIKVIAVRAAAKTRAMENH